MLTVAGKQPFLGGNLGNIETLSLLPEITADDWVVLELGNWMLEGLHTIRRSPQLAIFTNLLPDHLNAYDSMEDYGEAKSSIFRYQGPGRHRALQRRQRLYPTLWPACACAEPSGITAQISVPPGCAISQPRRVPSRLPTTFGCVGRTIWAMCRRRRWPLSRSASTARRLRARWPASRACRIGWRWCAG